MSRTPFLLWLASFVSWSLAVRADAPPGASYFEESDPAVSWDGPWSTNPLAANSGGSARLAMDAGAQARFVFNGTGVSWIGYRDEWCGIADVSLDGVFQASVETYSAPARAQAALYTITGLGRGTHALTIRTTGTHNNVSAGSWVWVDAFSVDQASAPGPAPLPNFIPWHSFPPPAGRAPVGASLRWSGTTRFEQDDPAVTWSGSWSTNHLSAHSGGSARLSMEASSRVSLVFVGSGVTWIGYRDEWSGIADVLLDGRRTTVDTYSSSARAQAALYALDGLPEGTHTLVIQPTGGHRPASGGSWIWVDAFSVRR